MRRGAALVTLALLPACDLVFKLDGASDPSGDAAMPVVHASVDPKVFRIPQTETATVSVMIEAEAGHSVSLSAMASPATTGAFDDAPPTGMMVPANGVLDTDLTWRPLEIAHQTIDLAASVDGNQTESGQVSVDFVVDRVLGEFEDDGTTDSPTAGRHLIVARRVSLDVPWQLTALGVYGLSDGDAVLLGLYKDKTNDPTFPDELLDPNVAIGMLSSTGPIEVDLIVAGLQRHVDSMEGVWIVALLPADTNIVGKAGTTTDTILTASVLDTTLPSHFPSSAVAPSGTVPTLYAVAHAE